MMKGVDPAPLAENGLTEELLANAAVPSNRNSNVSGTPCGPLATPASAAKSGSIEVNFMDDVGQTLLNVALAFGTQEMVEFLCAKGADVNKGQRSSSLHYAACFGRPAMGKVLLRHGANPELRDEVSAATPRWCRPTSK